MAAPWWPAVTAEADQSAVVISGPLYSAIKSSAFAKYSWKESAEASSGNRGKHDGRTKDLDDVEAAYRVQAGISAVFM